jgi:hypothetical protein
MQHEHPVIAMLQYAVMLSENYNDAEEVEAHVEYLLDCINKNDRRCSVTEVMNAYVHIVQKPRKYYASIGQFGNRQKVYVFYDRKERDRYVHYHRDAHAISRAKATNYAGNCGDTAPRPFTSERWAIVNDGMLPSGAVGKLDVVNDMEFQSWNSDYTYGHIRYMPNFVIGWFYNN